MSGLLIPIGLVVLALITAVVAYRDIRRGGARFYTLEREAMLRRASRLMWLAVLLLLGAFGLLAWERQQTGALDAANAGEEIEGVATATPTPEIQQFPPTPTLTSTPDLSLPTPTVTPVICRASIEETGGSGLVLRDAPGGSEVRILPEGTIVTLLEDAPQTLNNITWRRVRVLGGDEGWVSQDFLSIAAPCE
ncbi:MAG: SH3 domain-containing protein [Anaerolineales bacterium]|nr:SH3 domain-containing protein [Anaerolineales bacterium]